MSRASKLSALVAVLIVLAAGVAIGIVVDRAWLGGSEPAMGPPGPPLERHLKHFRTRLGLSDEQTEGARAILAEAKERAGAIHRDVEPQLMEIRDRTRAQIRELLSPEQAAEYDTMSRELDEKFRRKRERWMRGGKPGPRGGRDRMIERLDDDGDGLIRKAELSGHDHPFAGRLLERFDALDRDGDAALSRAEIRAGRPSPGWVTVFREDFESESAIPSGPPWQPDSYPDGEHPFSDNGEYFRRKGISPPAAFRRSAPMGQDGWLVAESYSRSRETPIDALVRREKDPADGANHVLRVASPAHTDATVIRSRDPLPRRYRISLRVGYSSFGDGIAGGQNGYDGDERATPWLDNPSTRENGFYWLAILDTVPRPHNNVWIHHHRKVVMDSDNHFPPWMEIHDGQGFVKSGQSPLMMFAVDGTGTSVPKIGKPFLSWSAGALQPSGEIRAVDSYLPNEWYRVSVERNGDRFIMTASGRFRHGGQRTYRAVIDAATLCVFHYNRPGEGARDACIDETPIPKSGLTVPEWPADGGWPDYFMVGDPHINYYEGAVHYDDILLEEWRD